MAAQIIGHGYSTCFMLWEDDDARVNHHGQTHLCRLPPGHDGPHRCVDGCHGEPVPPAPLKAFVRIEL